MSKPAFSRVLLKVSGEALMGSKDFGIDMDMAGRVAGEVADAVNAGTQVALVIGGGNIFRGVAGAAGGMDRANADQMGMLATVMNALAMQDVLGGLGVDARAMSAIPMPTVCEPFLRSKALWHLNKGRVVLCAAGTGNPFFTTDTGAALRAAELKCDALFKGTSVDGVYSDDPKKNPDTRRFETLTYDEMLAKNLQVMDGAAVALARDNAIPVIVFSIREAGEFNKVLAGEGTFTRITV
jgi:uridylate kinase